MIRNRIAEMLKKGTCVGLAAALIMSATVPAATSVAEAAEPVQNSEVMVNAENASPVSEEKENIDENTTTTTENQNKSLFYKPSSVTKSYHKSLSPGLNDSKSGQKRRPAPK